MTALLAAPGSPPRETLRRDTRCSIFVLMTPMLAPSEMLSEMSACAHRLGMAFAAQAEAEADWRRKAELFQLFDRCFFSVRVAIALELRLRRETGVRAPAGVGGAVERAENPEIERDEAPERFDAYDERDRDRESDRERVSLPRLLSTLKGVAGDAAALPGPTPAELPNLHALLARVGVQPSPSGATATPRAAPSPATPLKARLTGSAGAALAILPTPRSGEASPLRRATGPPRRR